MLIRSKLIEIDSQSHPLILGLEQGFQKQTCLQYASDHVSLPLVRVSVQDKKRN